MQARSSDESFVCLSVRPFVTRVYCDKTVERSVQIYISLISKTEQQFNTSV